VKIDSIKMSLMRFCDELKEEKEILEIHISNVIASSVLELKNDLVVFTIKQDAILSKINLIMEFIHSFRFFQLIQGTEVFTVLADQNKKDEIKKVFSPLSIIDIIENQSALILISPKEIVQVQGVVAYLTYLMAYSGEINITQIMSCYTDTIFVVDRVNALKAYNLIEEKIYFLRELREHHQK